MSTSGRALAGALLALAPGVFAGPARGWTVDGHAMVARAGVETLPAELPTFFRHGGGAVAHASVDPDLFKARDAPALRDAESPEHYLDLEYLGGATPRPKRYEYLGQLHRLELVPERVGFLPHAINEGVERLSLVFAEHRRFPDDPVIQAKVLYVAGRLAHYASDLCQPLHTTIHFDGRVGASGRSPRSGIHHRVDQLFGRLGPGLDGALDGIEPRVVSPLFDAILAEMESSHALVERVYALEPRLEWTDGQPPPEVRDFARQRYRASVAWVSSLLLTAWERSARVELPFWAIEQRRQESSPPPR